MILLLLNVVIARNDISYHIYCKLLKGLVGCNVVFNGRIKLLVRYYFLKCQKYPYAHTCRQTSCIWGQTRCASPQIQWPHCPIDSTFPSVNVLMYNGEVYLFRCMMIFIGENGRRVFTKIWEFAPKFSQSLVFKYIAPQ